MSDLFWFIAVVAIVFAPFILAELIEERWPKRTWPFSKHDDESIQSRMRRTPGGPH